MISCKQQKTYVRVARSMKALQCLCIFLKLSGILLVCIHTFSQQSGSTFEANSAAKQPLKKSENARFKLIFKYFQLSHVFFYFINFAQRIYPSQLAMYTVLLLPQQIQLTQLPTLTSPRARGCFAAKSVQPLTLLSYPPEYRCSSSPQMLFTIIS